MNPLLAVGIVSIVISVIITLIAKYTTNQDLMKRLKTEMKELQKEMKELKSHPEEMMKVQKKSMETNMKYMGQSFRSTLFTFIPIILIFSWMNANFAYEPISPEEQFQITLQFAKGITGEVTLTSPDGIAVVSDTTQAINNNMAIFTLKGAEGDYIEGNSLRFDYKDVIFYKDVIITKEPKYAKKEERIKNNDLRMISIGNRKKVILPGLNWGWLGSYIIFSIVFSMLLRKWFKVF